MAKFISEKIKIFSLIFDEDEVLKRKRLHGMLVNTK